MFSMLFAIEFSLYCWSNCNHSMKTNWAESQPQTIEHLYICVHRYIPSQLYICSEWTHTVVATSIHLKWFTSVKIVNLHKQRAIGMVWIKINIAYNKEYHYILENWLNLSQNAPSLLAQETHTTMQTFMHYLYTVDLLMICS